MPTRIGPPVDLTGARAALPSWLTSLLDSMSMSPVTTALPTEPMLQSISKPISELLDTVLTTSEKQPGLARRLRFTNWDARKNLMEFHPTTNAAPGKGLVSMGIDRSPVQMTPAEVDRLMESGGLGIDQPPASGTQAILAKLRKALGSSDVPK